MFRQKISITQLRHFLTTIVFLLISGHLFSQTGKTTKANPGRQSDTLKASGIYKAQVYFSGNGLPYVKSYISHGSDLNLLMKNIDSASNGAVVTFDYLTFYDGNGVATKIEKIPYNFNRGQDTVKFKSKAVQEVDKLRELDFISGTIYFAGFGFNNVTSVKAQDKATLHQYYDRSGPGTTITIDNCIYKNADGKLSSPLNKSLKLE
jgi:hypothetical protein